MTQTNPRPLCRFCAAVAVVAAALALVTAAAAVPARAAEPPSCMAQVQAIKAS